MLTLSLSILCYDDLILELKKCEKDIKNYISSVKEDHYNFNSCDINRENVFEFFDFYITFIEQELYFTYNSQPNYEIYDTIYKFLSRCVLDVLNENFKIKVSNYEKTEVTYYFGTIYINKNYYFIYSSGASYEFPQTQYTLLNGELVEFLEFPF